jgi:hypothetical protein
MHLVGSSRKHPAARPDARARRARRVVNSFVPSARTNVRFQGANRIGAETISRFIDATNLLILWVFAPTLSSCHGCCIYRKSYPN